MDKLTPLEAKSIHMDDYRFYTKNMGQVFTAHECASLTFCTPLYQLSESRRIIFLGAIAKITTPDHPVDTSGKKLISMVSIVNAVKSLEENRYSISQESKSVFENTKTSTQKILWNY